MSSCTPYNVMIRDTYDLDGVLVNNKNDKVDLFSDYFCSDFDSHSVMPCPPLYYSMLLHQLSLLISRWIA